MKIVLGYGPKNSGVVFVGEAPGRVEARTGIPFTGPSGDEQKRCLSLFGLDINRFYRTNVCKEYRDNNPDPTYSQIIEWTPTLLSELEEVAPRLIVCVGRFAAQFFLGFDCPPLETIHGIPHKSTRNDLPLSCSNSIILPIYHPAASLYARDSDEPVKREIRSRVLWDYEQVAEIYKLIRDGKSAQIQFRYDPFAGREQYHDVTGRELESILSNPTIPAQLQGYTEDLKSITPNLAIPSSGIVGIDTEGRPGERWSTQLSLFPGEGYLLRTSQPDFYLGMKSLETFLHKHKPLIALHDASTPISACYDVVACREMHCELQSLPWFNTMFWLFLQRLESQSLKISCDRWQGMYMEDYESILGGVAKDKQLSYLECALGVCQSFDKPSKLHIKENTGLVSTPQPSHLKNTILSIFDDIEQSKLNKDGPVNPFNRWIKLKESNPEHTSKVESILGSIPEATLDDVPLEDAKIYACRDSDGTLRNAITFLHVNARNSRLHSLMSEGMRVLPYIERMQANGMPVSRSYFISLRDQMQSELDELNIQISTNYWDGKPFNPKSPPQVASLIRRRGLKPLKRTNTGSVSTSEDSIGYLRFEDDAIRDVFEWRERQHNRDTYCNDVLARIPPDHIPDLYTIISNIKTTTVPTRRLAAKNPNILGIPSRSELGTLVRRGYIAPPGKIWCGFDLSGVEMRCLAHLSRDPKLIKVFLDKIHPHKMTATGLFKLQSLDDVNPIQKAAGKETNFLTIFGGGHNTLFEKLQSQGISEFSREKCREFLNLFFEMYPGVDEYRKQVASKCRRTEVSYDHWGMARYVPGINSSNYEIRSDEERIAVSQEVQGLAQGMIRNSMIWLMPKLDEMVKEELIDIQYFRLLLHDELIFLVNEGEEEMLGPLVLHALTKECGIELIVPIEAEEHYGKDWGSLK